MKNLAITVLLKFWDSPLFIRSFFSKLGAIIVTHSSNSRCKDYLDQIAEACRQNQVELTPSIKRDILKSFILYGASPNEYFLFKFNERSLAERDKFITDAYRTQLQKKIIGLGLFKRDLINKFNFYELNKEFFKRECLKVSKETSYEDFINFVKRNGKVFIKENAGSFGYNAHLAEYTDNESLKFNYAELHLNEGAEWIAEGLVVQDERMAVWNKSSVNTVRIPSFIIDGGKDNVVFMPFIRTGRAGAVVDNAGAGGIFAVIDEKTGTIITDGADESFNRFEKHPDAGIKYKGWQIPLWDELMATVKKAHQSMKNHKYIAYDFALTKNGWVMIEGNWGQYVCQQTATQIGAKEKFVNLIQSI